MFFFAAFLIITLSCIAITYKTLVGYGGYALSLRLAVFVLLSLAWFGPFLWRFLRSHDIVEGAVYALGAKITYFFMGFAFIVVMLLLLREVVWYGTYFIARRASLNPDNVALLAKLNIITITLAFLISVYAVWQANKTPAVRFQTVEDSRILKDTRFVVASDLHIDQATPMFQIRQIVDLINAQNPDYILLVGDVIDDTPEKLEGKVEELLKLKAKKVFVSLGNHEYYNRPALWMIKFTKMGFVVLQNTGENVDETGIFLGGVPDAHSTNINLKNALYGSNENQYKVLMSHAPTVAESLAEGEFDLQVSGHTHGGQIFPFHYFAKQSNNNHLAGAYNVNGNRLFITRGAGYWGPPMRLLAPSDITVFDFRSKAND